MDYGATVGINRQWGYSHLIVSNFTQHLGIIEGDRNDEGKFLLYTGTPLEHAATEDELNGRELLVPSQRIEHTRVALDNNFNLGTGRLTALLGYQHNKRKEFGDVYDPGTPGTFFDLKTFNYNIAYHILEKNGWKTSVGINGMSQQNKNKAEEALIPDYQLFDMGSYIFIQKTMKEKITATGGIRYDYRNLQTEEMLDSNGKTKFKALDKSFSNITASAGLSYAANDALTVKANISRAFRAPGVAELTANGEHEGTNRYEIGTPGLKSETTIQADAGIDYAGSHVSVSITPFFNRINNYIFLQKLESSSGGDSLITGDNGSQVPGYHYQQQDDTIAGFEMSIDIHPHPLDWLHFENSISYANGRFSKAVDGSYNLPMISPFRYLSELRAEWARPHKLKIFQNLYAKLELDANAKQSKPFTGYHTETATAGYTLLNAGAGTDLLVKKHRICSFYFSLNNIFDEAYQSHLSRLKYTAENFATGRTGVFNMGRNFTARLVIPLEFKIKAG
jgi:iron complex outermembrane receptor protein